MARGLANFDSEALRAIRMGQLGNPAMSADELARRVKATKPQILAYESGDRTPDPPRIRALAEALGVHPLQLSSRQHVWQGVDDLRRSCGFCADELVTALGISPKVYRRFEIRGIVPARRPTLPEEVAAVLGVGWTVVDTALQRSPAVRERIQEITELTDSMRRTYVERNVPWVEPRPADDAIQRLSQLLHRSHVSVSRVMRHILEEERRRQARIAEDSATAMLDPDAEKRRRARQMVELNKRSVLRSSRELPRDLEAFFRHVLPMEGWDVLVKLLATPDLAGFLSRIRAYPTALALVPQHLMYHLAVGDDYEVSMSPQGFMYCRRFIRWYTALYPSVKISEDVQRRLRAPRWQVAVRRPPDLGGDVW